jgi:hypothetical protein
MYKPTHIGLKNVNATPMTRGDYNTYRGWSLPSDERFDDDGYLIEYEPRSGEESNVQGREGYVSWTPKQVFDDSYHNINDNLPFGLAIELAKQGFTIARRDWYGSGFRVRMQQSSTGSDMTQNYLYLQYPTILPCGNCSGFYHKVPWIPLQMDILSSDWCVVKEED